MLFRKNNIIYIRTDESIFAPNAEEIYSVIFEGNKIIRNNPVSSDEFHSLNLVYNKEVVLPVLIISLNVDDNELALNPGATSLNNTSPLTIDDTGIIDYIITNDNWFPLPQDTHSSFDYIKEKLDLSNWGMITIGQYIELKKNQGYELTIVDNSNISLDAGDLSLLLKGEPPKLLNAKLYPYQLNGYLWLSYMSSNGLGCLIADEMGLGKTIQVICLLLDYKKEKKIPNLVITPSTILENWRRELSKFAPNLKVLIHAGASRTGIPLNFLDYDIVLCSYDIALRDISIMMAMEWNLLIIDEAQFIKNPEAKRTINIKKITRNFGIAVTGTPVENKLRDLWSIMDFTVPGILGSLLDFESRHSNDVNGASLVEPVVSPLILRRTIDEVAKDLPEIIYIPQPIIMDERSARAYEEIRELHDQNPLALLTRLRMFSAHPWLQNYFRDKDPLSTSMKLTRLLEIVEEIAVSGHKVLIFSSFSESIDIIKDQLQINFGLWVKSIDGRVPVNKRMPLIDEFSDRSDSAALILNPKAAGAGINLTAANHVIHYNLEWNPAVEDQATARAYRRGQTRPVTVHRLYYSGTVEEYIDTKMQAKRNMAEAAIIGVDGTESKLDDILAALAISPLIKG